MLVQFVLVMQYVGLVLFVKRALGGCEHVKKQRQRPVFSIVIVLLGLSVLLGLVSLLREAPALLKVVYGARSAQTPYAKTIMIGTVFLMPVNQPVAWLLFLSKSLMLMAAWLATSIAMALLIL